MCRGVMNLSCHQCSSAGTDTALEALLAFFAAFSLSHSPAPCVIRQPPPETCSLGMRSGNISSR